MELKSQLVNPAIEKGTLRVAFATKDGVHINDHFGWAKFFVLYDISKESSKKAGQILFEETKGEEACDPDKKNFVKIDSLKDCHIVYSQQIGGPAAARLTRNKIHPLVVKGDPPIQKVLGDLKKVLNGPIPPWLRKLTQTEDPNRFDRFDEEDDE